MEERRTRGRPRIYLNEGERLQIRRQRETPQERAARREIDSARHRQRRENEDPDERNVRLQENANRQQQIRSREDAEQRSARLERNAQREQGRRESQGVAERAARLEENTERQRRRRESESVAERASRLEGNAQRQQRRRELESAAERAARLEVNTQRQRRRRELEGDAQRAARLEGNAQRQRRRRQEERNQERGIGLQAGQARQLEIAEQIVEQRGSRSPSNILVQQRRQGLESAEEQAPLLMEDVEPRRLNEGEHEQPHVQGNRRRRSGPAQFVGAALRTRVTEVNYLGELNQRCIDCAALHFASEVKPNHPGKFKECCHLGKFTLNLFENFPEELRRLYVREPESTAEQRHLQKNFLENIRSFNSALAMASMGAQVDSLPGRGPYCYRIHGQIYHRLGPLHPRDGEPRQYGQIYILDTELAAQQRLGNARNTNCDPQLMRLLSDLLSNVNTYARSFKMMSEVERAEIALAAQENRTPVNIRMVFEESAERGLVRRQYDLPTANEVAVIYVGEDNDLPANRSLAVHLRGGEEQLINIRDIDKICDPLTYPLLFPTGEGGWDPNMRNTAGSRITQKDYYAYLFSIRDTFNPILHAGKLCQQFAVDAYVKIEQNRLNYQRRNQLTLRRDSYTGLQDHLAGDEISGPPGNRIILSSSHLGSPRAMQQAYQDAMAIVARYGKPTYFLTVTCNPQWKEIQENLFHGQSPSDRPDLVARVFNAKLLELCNDLLKHHVLGEVEAYVYVIEFQKRGLPHCHMLLIMKEEWKVRTAEDVDKCICAEIPDREAEPELHSAVISYMIHRQCGPVDPSSPCMQSGSCSKRFPKPIRDRTSLDVDGYPYYRRRNLFPTEINGIPYSDQWVVSTNPYLLLKYDCHINVEMCGTISAVKYLYKYIYKGPDRARIRIEGEGETDANNNVDEIRQHLNTRYVCAPQSIYRIFGYTMQDKSHTVCRLAVHLPEFQTVHFVQGQEQQYFERAQQSFTTLTAFFELNRRCNEMYERGLPINFPIDARNIYYYQFPEYFTFDVRRGWTPRRREGKQNIGRMYTVSPLDAERYCLRVLLLNTKGKTSFEDMRTIDGRTYESFAEAAKAAGFLDDDRYFRQSLQEAAHYQSAPAMRSFFACLLCFCEVMQAQELWEEFADMMLDDYTNQGVDRDRATAMAYYDILDRVAVMGRDLRQIVTPPTTDRPVLPITPMDYANYERIGSRQYGTLNVKQKEAADDILDALDRAQNKCIFVDGPGGSGKTYLYSTVYNMATGRRRRVQCVAWTGIAANLLPEGRTVNSVFKLNIADGNRTSIMRRQQKEARQLMETDLIIWDEISMAPRTALEAVDVLLRDLMQVDTPFGGKVFVIGGDFRQILPVVEHGQREDIVEACVLKSFLWPMFRIHRLELNMRARDAGSDWRERLLEIGNGESNDGEGRTMISEEMMCTTDIVSEVFGEVLDPSTTSELCENAILAPKNVHVQRLNDDALQRLTVDRAQDERIYKSIDEAIYPEGETRQLFQMEYLNSLTPTGLPPHELHLKKGAIVMLLRNLDVANGLCNGTRLKVETLGRRTLACRFVCGERINQLAIIPRIDNYWDQRVPFRLRRRQFPVRVAFAMTINKAQGQSFNKVGVFLPEDVFSHGQLYVALSRARTPDGVRVKSPSHSLKNIVFSEVLF